MTHDGGTNGLGTIFKIMLNGTGYSKLYDFGANLVEGSNPQGSLYYDGTFLYGMTSLGGANTDGLIFKIKPDGTGYTKLLDFNGANGLEPHGSLISDGTFLYGMTFKGGANSKGVIFKIKPDGTGNVNLHAFGNATDGASPDGDLYYDGTYLYGMTHLGGTSNIGTIFKIMPNGTGYTVLYNFLNSPDGNYPYNGSLISDGTFLYGMANGGASTNPNCGGTGCGMIFKIKPNGTGYTNVLNLVGYTTTAGAANGQYPQGSLISVNSTLYGMTTQGGQVGHGNIFKLAGVVGIEQFTTNNELVNIYPNPSNGSFVIETNITEKQILNIYDINGRIVLSQTINSTTTIDASKLNAGIYNLNITSREGVANKKLVIVK